MLTRGTIHYSAGNLFSLVVMEKCQSIEMR